MFDPLTPATARSSDADCDEAAAHIATVRAIVLSARILPGADGGKAQRRLENDQGPGAPPDPCWVKYWLGRMPVMRRNMAVKALGVS